MISPRYRLQSLYSQARLLKNQGLDTSQLSALFQPYGNGHALNNSSRHFVPSTSVEFASVGCLRTFFAICTPATPLLEEECDLLFLALNTHSLRPFSFHRTRLGPRFTTDDDPVNICEVKLAHIGKKRFYGKKSNTRRHLAQMIDARHSIFPVLHGHA